MQRLGGAAGESAARHLHFAQAETERSESQWRNLSPPGAIDQVRSRLCAG